MRTLTAIMNYSRQTFHLTIRNEDGTTFGPLTIEPRPSTTQSIAPGSIPISDDPFVGDGAYAELAAIDGEGATLFAFRFAASSVQTTDSGSGWLYGGFACGGPGSTLTFPLQCRMMDPWPADSPMASIILKLFGDNPDGTDFHVVVAPPGSTTKRQEGGGDGGDGGGDGGGSGGEAGDSGDSK